MASTACFASARVASASAASTSSSSDPPPRRDYAALFARRKVGGCPPLFLAPMEGLGDHRLRRALALSTGGFDEACREFTRVPGVLSQGAKPERLLRGIALNGYDARELVHPDSRAPHLLGAQLMGSNPELLERCARFLAEEGGAPRVDLNCGCPANVVTGKGAGSSLLRDPRDVEACVAAVRRGVAGTGAVATLKLRSGFDDKGLLRENLLAAQEGGAEFITLHPRTRAQGYSGRAEWADIAFAVDLLDVPVVGNGDVTSPLRAAQMIAETGCAGVMIGRGAVQDPLVFRRVAAALACPGYVERAAGGSGGAREDQEEWWGLDREEEAEEVCAFLRRFAAVAFDEKPARKPRKHRPNDLENFKLGKLKQVCKYLFAGNPGLVPHISRVLGADAADVTAEETLARVEALVRERWTTPEDVLVDAFSMRTRYADGVAEEEKARRMADEGTLRDVVRS